MRRVGDLPGQHPQRLQREGTGQPVGEEPGAVLGPDRRAAHAPADLGGRLEGLLGRVGVATTSTSFISAGGLKKCMPTTRSGCGTSGADLGTGSEEVLRREDRPVSAGLGELGEQSALQLEVLGRGLDHQVAAGQARQLLDGRQPLAGSLGLRLAPQPPPRPSSSASRAAPRPFSSASGIGSWSRVS